MTEDVIAHRPREISGFTLFWSDSRYDNGKDPPKVPGWQMNVRRKGENGWDCKQISDEQARAILSMLETSGHPDGPWTVKDITCRLKSEIQRPEDVADFLALVADWKTALIENTEARNGLA